MRSAEGIGPREKLYVSLQNVGFYLNRVFGSLHNKISSAYSVVKVYGPRGFEVIKAYTLGGKTHIYNLRVEVGEL